MNNETSKKDSEVSTGITISALFSRAVDIGWASFVLYVAARPLKAVGILPQTVTLTFLDSILLVVLLFALANVVGRGFVEGTVNELTPHTQLLLHKLMSMREAFNKQVELLLVEVAKIRNERDGQDTQGLN